MRKTIYNRVDAVNYARTWAFKRNPNYYNFDNLGGDCTNFVSQCVFAGTKVMNFTPVFGWYYNHLNDRTPSWSGVEYFHNFLTKNDGLGPVGIIVDLGDIQIADVIFLKRFNDDLYHTLFVNDVIDGQIYVSSHTFDAYNRNLYSYNFNKAVCVHIDSVNIK